jgi:putative nucleotidyltransferase with HDIG domain
MNAQALFERVRDFRSPSPAVARLVGLLAQPEADNDEIIRVVQMDSVLSAKLLALCNSAAFGARAIGSIDQAVLHLGHREVFRLAISLGCGAAVAPALPGYGMEANALWRHSLLTALVTAPVMAALPVPAVEPGVAYTAGLLHDIGKVVLGQVLEVSSQARIRELVLRDDCALVEAERQVIGIDHAELGAWLLEKWRLPDVIVEAVAHHHVPVLEPRVQLSAVVHIADMLAHQAGAAPGWASYSVRAGDDTSAILGLSAEAVQNLLIATIDATTQVDEMASAA